MTGATQDDWKITKIKNVYFGDSSGTKKKCSTLIKRSSQMVATVDSLKTFASIISLPLKPETTALNQFSLRRIKNDKNSKAHCFH